jgi:adhesin/invasin
VKICRNPLPHPLLLAAVVGVMALGVSCVDDLPLGLPPVVELRIVPDSTDLRIGDELQLQVLPLDEGGGLVLGLPITWASDASGIASVGPDGTILGVGSGTATLTATVGELAATARVRVQPAPFLDLSPSEWTIQRAAGEPDPPPETIAVENSGGFTLEGLSVAGISYSDGADGWLDAGLDGSVAPATLTLTVDAESLTDAGTYIATVAVTAIDAEGSPGEVVVTLVIGPGEPANVETQGENQSGVVGTPVAVPPTLRLTDSFGNPVPGVPVAFAVTAGGGSVTGPEPETDEDGRATVGSWILGPGVGENTLVATPEAAGIQPVTFSAVAASGAPADMAIQAGNEQSATVGLPVAVAPVVRVEDEFGNPVPGVPVTFSVVEGEGSVQGGSQTTDGDGMATVGGWTLGTSTAQANRLAASVGNGEGDGPSVEFVAFPIPDDPDALTVIAGAGQSGIVGEPVPVLPAVRVEDQYENPVPGVTVTFSAPAASGGLDGAVQETDASGSATLGGWTLGTMAGTQAVTASVTFPGVDPVTVSVDVVAGDPSALVTDAGDNQSASVGAPVGIPPRVRANDAFGNPVSGVQVTFTVTAGEGEVTDPVQVTDALGLASVGSWTLGPETGQNNNTLAAATPGLDGSPLVFTASANPADAENLILASGDGQSGTVAQSLPDPHIVRVTDGFGNGVAGVSVGWEVTGGGGSITPSSVTDEDGFASATRTLGTDASVPHTARAVVGGLTGSPVSFTATALADAPASIAASAPTSQSATVDTPVSAPPAVLVADQFGNPVAGHPVSFEVTAGGGSLDPAGGAATTGESGVAALAGWTLGAAAGTGNNSVVATAQGDGIQGNPVGFTASGSPGPPDPDLTAMTVSDDEIGACQAGCSTGAGTAATVTVTVVDGFGNAIGGAEVTIAVDGTDNYLAGEARSVLVGSTNGSGVFAASFHSTRAEGKTVTGTVEGLAGSRNAGVTVVPGPPDSGASAFSVSDPSITACETSCTVGATAATLTVTARDAFDNPIAGAAVTLTVTGGAGGDRFDGVAGASASGAADGDGVFTRVFNATSAQAKTFDAAITNQTTVNLPGGLTVEPAGPTTLALISGTGQTQTTGLLLAVSPTVEARDPWANPVPGVSVLFAIQTGGGALRLVEGASDVGTQTSVTTGSNGRASVDWRVRATAPGAADGTTANGLEASIAGGSIVQAFGASGRFSYVSHVHPLWSNYNCLGCHGSLGGLTLNAPPATVLSALRNQTGVCNPSFVRVHTGGGTTNADTNSLLLRVLDRTTSNPNCTSMMGSEFMPAGPRDTIRAWIRNTAPDN